MAFDFTLGDESANFTEQVGAAKDLEDEPSAHYLCYAYDLKDAALGIENVLDIDANYATGSPIPVSSGGFASVFRFRRNHRERQSQAKIPFSRIPEWIVCRRPSGEDSGDRSNTWREVFAELSLLRSDSLRNHENINKIRSVEFPRWRMQAGGADIRLDMSDSPLFVYDFAEHGSLASFVRQRAAGDQPLGLDMRKHLVRDVGNGLQALHRNGMAHCDLKPENVLVFKCPQRGDEGIIAKISDFGTLTPLSAQPPLALSKIWAAPEQHLRSNMNVPACMAHWDVYSFGLVAFYTFSGGTNPLEAVSRLQEPLKDVHGLPLPKGMAWHALKTEEAHRGRLNYIISRSVAFGLQRIRTDSMTLDVIEPLFDMLDVALSHDPLKRDLDYALKLIEGTEGSNPKQTVQVTPSQHCGCSAKLLIQGSEIGYFDAYDSQGRFIYPSASSLTLQEAIWQLPRFLRIWNAIDGIASHLEIHSWGVNRISVMSALRLLAGFAKAARRPLRWSEVLLSQHATWVLLDLWSRDLQVSKAVLEEMRLLIFLQQKTYSRLGLSLTNSCALLPTDFLSNVLEQFRADDEDDDEDAENKVAIDGSHQFASKSRSQMFWKSKLAVSHQGANNVTLGDSPPPFLQGPFHLTVSDLEAKEELQRLLEDHKNAKEGVPSPFDLNWCGQTALDIAFETGNAHAVLLLFTGFEKHYPAEMQHFWMSKLFRFEETFQKSILHLLISNNPMLLTSLVAFSWQTTQRSSASFLPNKLPTLSRAILLEREDLIDLVTALAHQHLPPLYHDDFFLECMRIATRMRSPKYVLAFRNQLKDEIPIDMWQGLIMLQDLVLVPPLAVMLYHGSAHASKSVEMALTLLDLGKQWPLSCPRRPPESAAKLLDIGDLCSAAMQLGHDYLVPHFMAATWGKWSLKPCFPAVGTALAKGNLDLQSKILAAQDDTVVDVTRFEMHTLTSDSSVPAVSLESAFIDGLFKKCWGVLSNAWSPANSRPGLDRADLVSQLLNQGWIPSEMDLVSITAYLYWEKDCSLRLDPETYPMYSVPAVNKRRIREILGRILKKRRYTDSELQFLAIQVLDLGDERPFTTLLRAIQQTQDPRYDLPSILSSLRAGRSFIDVLLLRLADVCWQKRGAMVYHKSAALLAILGEHPKALDRFFSDWTGNLDSIMLMSHSGLLEAIVKNPACAASIKRHGALARLWRMYDTETRCHIDDSAWNGTGSPMMSARLNLLFRSADLRGEQFRLLRRLSIQIGGPYASRALTWIELMDFVKDMSVLDMKAISFRCTVLGFTLNECVRQVAGLRVLKKHAPVIRILLDHAVQVTKHVEQKQAWIDYGWLAPDQETRTRWELRADVCLGALYPFLWLLGYPAPGKLWIPGYADVPDSNDGPNSTRFGSLMENACKNLRQLVVLFWENDLDVAHLPVGGKSQALETWSCFQLMNRSVTVLKVIESSDLVTGCGANLQGNTTAAADAESILQNVRDAIESTEDIFQTPSLISVDNVPAALSMESISLEATPSKRLESVRRAVDLLSSSKGLFFQEETKLTLQSLAETFEKRTNVSVGKQDADDFLFFWISAVYRYRQLQVFLIVREEEEKLEEQSRGNPGFGHEREASALQTRLRLAAVKMRLLEGLRQPDSLSGDSRLVSSALRSFITRLLELSNFVSSSRSCLCSFLLRHNYRTSLDICVIYSNKGTCEQQHISFPQHAAEYISPPGKNVTMLEFIAAAVLGDMSQLITHGSKLLRDRVAEYNLDSTTKGAMRCGRLSRTHPPWSTAMLSTEAESNLGALTASLFTDPAVGEDTESYLYAAGGQAVLLKRTPVHVGELRGKMEWFLDPSGAAQTAIVRWLYSGALVQGGSESWYADLTRGRQPPFAYVNAPYIS